MNQYGTENRVRVVCDQMWNMKLITTFFWLSWLITKGFEKNDKIVM